MRLFVAHRIGGVSTARIEAIVAPLRTRLPKAGWVGAHAYHLTFAFLGDQSPDLVALLSGALKAAASGVAPIDARLAGAGFFPNGRRPRVGWIAIEPHEPVIAIVSRVRSELTARGVGFDDKPFKAHLTLVRIRDEWPARDADLFQRSIDEAGAVPFRLDRVALFESQLLHSGAVHTELAGFDLG